jgi:hypothetical protein
MAALRLSMSGKRTLHSSDRASPPSSSRGDSHRSSPRSTLSSRSVVSPSSSSSAPSTSAPSSMNPED